MAGANGFAGNQLSLSDHHLGLADRGRVDHTPIQGHRTAALRLGFLHGNQDAAGAVDFLGRRIVGVVGERDLARVDFIKCMRTAGLSLDTLARYIALVDEGDETVAERKQILVEEREKLAIRMAELQKTMEILDRKIGIYSNNIQEKAKRLNQLNNERKN